MVVEVDNQVYDLCREVSKEAMILNVRASVGWVAVRLFLCDFFFFLSLELHAWQGRTHVFYGQ